MDAKPQRVEKRNRPPVSCELCRTRKLKCNREQPCDTCVRRNKSSLCHYAANANRTKTGPSRSRDMKDRLNNLETLVSSILSGNATIQQGAASGEQISMHNGEADVQPNRQLATQAASSSPWDKSDTPLDPETPHLQETGDGQVNYVDASHWQSILDDIKEVRDHLSSSNLAMPQSQSDIHLDNVEPDASFVFGTGLTAGLDDILSALPPQPICDKLLSWYFQSRFLVQGIIHPEKFQQEYEAFWGAPAATSPLWIALLFAILSITSILRSIAIPGEADANVTSAKVLQRATVQCLVLGRYATANAHALEAFILHLQSCFISNDYRAVNVWFEMGTVIRLAFRMGYHRDPQHLPGINPFDGEMRRRLWLNLFQVEALMSFQMGLPSMIPTEFCDTELPRNLEYSDLRVGMDALPPGRPLTELTPVQYSIVKASVMGVFKKIVAHTQSLAPPAYEKTIALDVEMDQAYKGLPETLKARDVNRSFMDPSGLILQRCTLEMLHLKGTMVLHRRYINYDAQSVRFERSQQACVEAALKILARQADLHRACAPGGRLYEDRWMMASLPIHDFLLAAMVVCMDLSVRMRQRQQQRSGGGDGFGWADLDDGSTLAGREYRALQTSQKIWVEKSATSSEPHIAALTLELMLNKVAERRPGPGGNTDTDADPDPMRDHNHHFQHHLLPSFDASATAAMDVELPYAGPMSQMIDGSESIDWVLLDQYFQNLDGMEAESTF